MGKSLGGRLHGTDREGSTPLPEDVIYVPSMEELEVLPERQEVTNGSAADFRFSNRLL